MRQVSPVSNWESARETCPTCGDDVDLLEAHYQVELDRERPRSEGEKLTHERRLLAFCDADCADAWLDERDDR